MIMLRLKILAEQVGVCRSWSNTQSNQIEATDAFQPRPQNATVAAKTLVSFFGGGWCEVSGLKIL